MGEVYRARDSKLKREVAIKVLPQSVAADADSLARFEREALAVAALSHPNILAIHDFGNQDGIAYAVMELLEGETLRGKLDSGPIPQKQAVDYALQVARGLSAAHEKGIVHRDLKPENLFVSKDGHVKILDFGLAKKTETTGPEEQTSAPTGSGHTEAGTVMGTMGYMSPEQVRGLPVDHRSDIFSFGTILYEMLSGKKAFKRDTASDTIAAILKEEPPELTESGRNISPALDHIVKHCLEKDRTRRFQTASDVAFNLSEQSSSSVVSGASGVQAAATPARKSKVLIAVAAVAVLAAVSFFLLRRPHGASGETGGVKRVAVLPFENLGAPEDDYFADGIADEVRAKLTSVPGLQVIARGSSTPYKKTAKTPKQVSQELEAPYLLTATVRWEKSAGMSRVHVTPELVDVSGSGAPASTWQQPFDANLTDVFQVQSEIASKVAQALGVALGAGETKRLSEKPTENLAAYDSFLKGEELFRGSQNERDSERKQLLFYEQAVALDPGFARAWARVAAAGAFLYDSDPSQPELAERSRLAAERALVIAPESPETYYALGAYQRFVMKDNARAFPYYARGLSMAPGNPDLLRPVGAMECVQGRFEAGVEHLRQAERVDPRTLQNSWTLADALLYLRRYPQAREVITRGRSFAPGDLALIRLEVLSFLGQGDLEGARGAVKAAAKLVEPVDLVISLYPWVLDEQQRELLLRAPLDAFGEPAKISRPLALANLYGLRGDPAKAREHANESIGPLREDLRVVPENASANLRAALGFALACSGQKVEAIKEGEHALALEPVAKDAWFRPQFLEVLVKIYILVGEPEKALDGLEDLLKIPYYVSPAWLKIDPNFDPLRKNPRFQRLVAGM